MVRSDLMRSMRSWPLSDIVYMVMLLVMDRHMVADRLICAIDSTFTDAELNAALSLMGKGERIV